ncbi:MAG: hypothetical protein OXK80_05005 [Bdellovibrionales bacterium]|nr:hypothetical protein [Bdellovibrionales bacterium]
MPDNAVPDSGSSEDTMKAIDELASGLGVKSHEVQDIKNEIKDTEQGSTGDGMTNFMITSAIARNLATLAFDAETAQKVTGMIDITTGGILIPKSCPPPHTPGRVLKCIYGISAVANGAASMKSSKKSKDAAEDLGGTATAGNTTGGDEGPCNPFTDPQCRLIHCQESPHSPLCQCPDGSACPANGICPDGSTCGPSTTTCSNNSDCSNGQVCSNGTCINTNTCSNNSDCSNGQVCSNGTCINTNTCSNNSDCSNGQVCSNGTCINTNTCSNDSDCSNEQICSNGTCTNPTNTCSNDSDCSNEQICSNGTCTNPDTRIDQDPDDNDLCIELTGNDCDTAIRNACLQANPHCKIDPSNGNPVFYDPDGNPITHGNLEDLARQLGVNPDEMEGIKDELQQTHKNASNQVGAGSGSTSGSKNSGIPLLADDDTGESSLSGENFEPSLSNGGGSSANKGNSGGKRGASAPGFSRQLQSLLDQQKKNHQSSVKKHGYKPAKLGNQPIGTAHDNIFDMVSRGYQEREDSLNAR